MSERPTAKYCWACGAVAKGKAKFCTTCGKPLTKKIQASAGNKPTEDLSGKTVRLPSNIRSQNKTDYYKSTSRRETEPKTTSPAYSSPFSANKRAQTSNTPRTQTTKPPPTQIPQVEIDHKFDELRQDFSKYQDKMEGMIKGLYEERFDHMDKTLERLEYKLNAFNVENRIYDLEQKFEELNLTSQLDEINAKITSTPTKLDLEKAEKKIREGVLKKIEPKFTALENKVEEFGFDSEFQHLEETLDEKIENLELSSKFTRLEDRIDDANSTKRLAQLEEDIGDRLKISSTDLESKIDSVDLKMTEEMTKMSESIKSMVPALVKLTKKVTELNAEQEVKENKNTSKKSAAKSTSKPAPKSKTSTTKKESKTKKEEASKLDLPPFPKKTKKKTAQTE